MGMGKSYDSWMLAAIAYAREQRVLYIADAGEWMSVPPALRERYLINVFLSLNQDILDPRIVALLSHSNATFATLDAVLRDGTHPTLLIIDEHSELVSEYEQLEKQYSLPANAWMKRFVRMHLWEHHPALVVIFSGSSHSQFELTYLVNGQKNWRRFLGPVSPEEAKTMLRLQGLPSAWLKSDTLPFAMAVCNHVPRELRHLAEFAVNAKPSDKSVDAFVSQRKRDLLQEATNYSGKLKELKVFACCLVVLFLCNHDVCHVLHVVVRVSFGSRMLFIFVKLRACVRCAL